MLERSENKRNTVQITDLEGLVPKEHLVRKIDKVVDFDEVYDISRAILLRR